MPHRPEDYEKLGAFYLGRVYDPDAGAVRDDLLLYDAKDLTTHAVCVGMTGSGKTGLCVTLMEEAAIDGIPALVVDLKGDLVNLLFAFPDLAPSDFLPWVDPGEAMRKGLTPEELARKTAKLWRDGLAGWDQAPERIRRYRDAVEFRIYTPGSDAGRPLTVLRSFSAPPPEVLADADAFRGRIAATVAGLLALMGIDADPIQSREHILLSNILDRAWRDGKDLDIGGLLRQIQAPPFQQVGFFDLETFFPAADRLKLAMALNNLAASPGFSAWMKGDPLDIGKMLWNENGRPCVSILSLAHLADQERMFFLTVLLNEVSSWMRTQPGTSSLRALLYIDEVFGYLPPSGNPPTKTPLLTLLKQARAFGLGLVLATQNPVDVDYKALSNAGTWFLGRLQTERDKMRVVEGLEGASASSGAAFDRARTEALLAGLDSRVFLMNNVHEDEPVVFHTRWALSYLRGPVTRAQIRELTQRSIAAAAPVPVPAVAAAPAAPVKAPPVAADQEAGASRPILPDGIDEAFVPADRGAGRGGRAVYRPALAARVSTHYISASAGIDTWKDLEFVTPLTSDATDDPWAEASLTAGLLSDVASAPEDGIAFAELPSAAGQAKRYRSWSRGLEAHVYREHAMTTYRCRKPKGASRSGESEGEFRARLEIAAREKRDVAVEKLRKRWATKLERMRDRIGRAEDKVEREEAQYKQQRTSTAISIGSTLLGALFGRKLASRGNVGRAASSMKGASRAARERGDIARAEADLKELQEKLKAMEEEFADDVAELEDAAPKIEIEEKPLRPRKSDIEVSDLTLVWTPWVIDRDGIAEPSFSVPSP